MQDPVGIRFCCPLCGSTVFGAVMVTLPSGAVHKSSLLECAGCSVVFRDKERFTARAKFQQNPGAGPAASYMHAPERDAEGGKLTRN